MENDPAAFAYVTINRVTGGDIPEVTKHATAVQVG